MTLPDPISQSQAFPFHFHSAVLADRHGVSIRELNLDHFLAEPGNSPDGATTVLFQCWIDKTPAEVRAIGQAIRHRYPGARLGFLDPFAPTDLRYAEALHCVVDVYIKKHVLRDRSQYGQPTLGDTNLSDWYGRRYGEDQATVVHVIPEGFLNKLVVGPSFFTAPYMLPALWANDRPVTPRGNVFDLHARLGGTGQKGWYPRMRTEAVEALSSLRGTRITPHGSVSRRQYFHELSQSTLCFSPFGYGEVCWRDYEAAVHGAVLVKPDMQHVETQPNIFVPFETYIPIRWDFADLAQQVSCYLARPDECRRIAQGAFEVLSRHARRDGFVDAMQAVLS